MTHKKRNKVKVMLLCKRASMFWLKDVDILNNCNWPPAFQLSGAIDR